MTTQAEDLPAPTQGPVMPAPVDARCGTYAGWNSHKWYGSPVCDLCAAASRDYAREWRRKRGDTTSVLVPLALLRQVEAQVDETLATQIRSLTAGTAPGHGPRR